MLDAELHIHISMKKNREYENERLVFFIDLNAKLFHMNCIYF